MNKKNIILVNCGCLVNFGKTAILKHHYGVSTGNPIVKAACKEHRKTKVFV